MRVRWDLGMNAEACDESQFEALIAIGFRCLFVDLYPWEDETIQRAYQVVDRYRDRLIPWSIHLPFSLAAWDFDPVRLGREYTAYIEKAAGFGVKRAAIHPRLWPIPILPDTSPESLFEDYEDRVVEMLATCCRAAAPHGITLSLENDQWHEWVGMWLATAPDLLRLVERIGEPNVGICLDANHAASSGVNPAGFIREAGARLVDTHFNDTFGYFQGRAIAECDMHLPPGIGAINWAEVLDALDAIDYPNPIVFEVDPANLGSGMDDQNLRSHPVTYRDFARICYSNWRSIESARYIWDHVPRGSWTQLGQRRGLATSPQSPRLSS